MIEEYSPELIDFILERKPFQNAFNGFIFPDLFFSMT